MAEVVTDPQGRVVIMPATWQLEEGLRSSLDGVGYSTQALLLRLGGEVDLDALRSTVTAICARHEIIRTAVRERAGSIVQEISTSLAAELSVIAAEPGHDLLEELSPALGPFQFDQPPQLRAVLIGHRPELTLCLALPTYACDLAGAVALVNDLIDCYAALRLDDRLPPRDTSVQPGDIAEWERGYRDSPAEAHWARLGPLPPGPAKLATDHTTAHESHFDSAITAGVEVDGAAMATLEAIARAGRTTLAAVIASALARALLSADEPRIVISMIHANRDRPELAGTVGYLASPFPIVVDHSGTPSFRELVGRTAQCLHDARRNWLPARRLSACVTAQSAIALNIRAAGSGVLPEPRTVAGTTFTKIPIADPERRVPARRMWWGAEITFSVDRELDGTALVFVHYNRNTMRHGTAQALTHAFARSLAAADAPSSNGVLGEALRANGSSIDPALYRR